jgi:hypothetical protein
MALNHNRRQEDQGQPDRRHSSLDQVQEYVDAVDQERAADAATKLANSAGTPERLTGSD